jgi:hypothetical protein
MFLMPGRRRHRSILRIIIHAHSSWTAVILDSHNVWSSANSSGNYSIHAVMVVLTSSLETCGQFGSKGTDTFNLAVKCCFVFGKVWRGEEVRM